jgi:hypothetical protein
LVAAVEDAGFCPVIKRPSTIAKLCQSGGFPIAAAQSLQLILDKERYNVGEMYSFLFAVEKVCSRDKPLKYPHIFRAAELVLLNKIDQLPHVDFRRAVRGRQCTSGQSRHHGTARFRSNRGRTRSLVCLASRRGGGGT